MCFVNIGCLEVFSVCFLSDNPNSEIRGVFINGVFSGSLLFEGQLYGIEVTCLGFKKKQTIV